MRWIAAAVGLIGMVLVPISGCSHVEPVAPMSLAKSPSFIRAAWRARPDALGARRGRVQELQLLPSPSGGLVEDEVVHEYPLPNNGLCPPDMASIDDHYCIDRFEASLVEILPNGDERAWSPYDALDASSRGPLPVVRAVSAQGVTPQAYISEVQAKLACARSGKRLCRATEWKRACMGPAHTTYPYGATVEDGRCNDHGRAPMAIVFKLGGGSDPHLWPAHMNDPRLDQLPGTVATTGSHTGCTNDYGVYDMVGNVHEWIDDPNGTFVGGYYLDTHQLGDGCNYRTEGHDIYYHDYSTGFRCCADVAQ